MNHQHMHDSRRPARHTNSDSRRPRLPIVWWSLALLLLLSAAPAHAQVRYVYDESGRLVQVIGLDGKSTRYSYDAAGNITSMKQDLTGALVISEFTPDRGPIGTTVTISGVGFSTTVSANIVKFNGVTAVVSAATTTTLVTKVPTGATTGPIAVTVGTKTATSATPFTITTAPYNAAPVITSFTPRVGLPGAAVAIIGNNFSTTPANNFVFFNRTQATVGATTLTRINTSVPTGTTSGPIKVRTAAGTATSATDFFVVPTGYTAGDVSVTQRITVNGPALAINTGTAGKLAMVLFNGTQGQYLGLGVSPATTTGGSARLYIKTPSGTDLMSSQYFTSPFSTNFPRLPETGFYTMLIVPSASAVVNATLTLSTDITGTLISGSPLTLTTTRVGQNARYAFAANAGQNFSLALSGGTFPGTTYVYVYTPDGSQWTSTSISSSTGTGTLNLTNLPTTGTYTVFIMPSGLATGSISLTLWADATGTVAINGAATAGNLPLGRNGRYTFAGTTGQKLGLGITNLVTTPANGRVAITVYKPDGTTLENCGTFYASDGGDSCDLPALPTSGTYAIWVDNGAWASTFNLWLSADVSGALVLNTAKVFTTARVGQNARYTFAANAGQNFGLALNGGTFPGTTYVYMYTPDGSQWTSTSISSSRGTGTLNLTNLPTTGTYTVFITPSGLATGSISLTLWADATGTVAINGAATAGNLLLGRNGRYTFAGTTGQHLGLGVTNLVTTPTSENVRITVYKPDGTVLENCGTFYASDGGDSCDLPTLPASGTYAIWVDNGAWASTFNLWLSADVSGALVLNTAKVFTTTRVGQNARYTFAANAGQNFGLAFSGDTFPGYTYVYIYRPDGSQWTSTSISSSSGTGTLNLTNLPTTGTYTVFITPSGLATGSISLTLWADATGTVAINGAATAGNLPLGRNGRYTFAGAAGQRLGLGITNLVTTPPNGRFTITVYKPDGTVLENCGTFYANDGGDSCDLPALPASGTYAIWVDNGAWASTFNLWLSADVSGALVLNTAKVFTTTRVGQNARYTFAANAGQNLSLTFNNNTFPGYTYMYVYRPDGSQWTSTSVSYANSRTLNLTNLPVTGSYSVFITPSGVATGAISTTLNNQ